MNNPQEMLLLGAQDQIVKYLSRRIKVLQKGKKTAARVVVLRGRSEMGTSRIIQALYEQLRAGESAPKYWPALLGGGEHSYPAANREWISPQLHRGATWDAEALPSFGWWAFYCAPLAAGDLPNEGADTRPVVDAARPQLDAHVAPLTRAHRNLTDAENKSKAGSLLSKLGFKQFKSLRQRAAEQESPRADVGQPQVHEEPRKSAEEKLAEVISSLSHPKLPAVVAIEDIHLIGSDLLAMIKALPTDKDRPVLVVATATPEGQTNNESSTDDYRTWLKNGLDLGTVEMLDVAQLNSETFAYSLNQAGPIDKAPTVEETLVSKSAEVLNYTDPVNLAGTLGNPQLADEIITRYEAVIDDCAQMLGADHPSILQRRYDLASYLEEIGKTDEAIKIYRSLVDNSTRMLGANHPDTLTYRCQLATSLTEAGQLDVDEAITIFTALIHDSTRVLGADHPETLTMKTNLACTLGDAGRIDDAITMSTALVEDSTRILGADHPNTLNARSNLAYALDNAGQVEEALSSYRAVIDDSTRMLGANDSITLNARHNLAYLLGELGQTDEAIITLTALVEDSTRIRGADHPATLIYQNNLASRLGNTGRIDEAITRYEGLVDDFLRILGDNHPSTLTCQINLAYWREQAGQVESDS